MAWHIVMHLFSALVDWFRIGRLQDHEKDLEILILRLATRQFREKADSHWKPSR